VPEFQLKPKEPSMSPKVLEFYQETKSFNQIELDELVQLILDDPRLSEDILDLALIREAEAEGGDSVTLEEFRAGKRTYNVN
jgi:hypothetical protein